MLVNNFLLPIRSSYVCQKYNTQIVQEPPKNLTECFFQSPEKSFAKSLGELTDTQNGYTVTRIFSPNHQTESW